MSQAAVFDTFFLKWPFIARPRRTSRPDAPAPSPMQAPAQQRQPAAVQRVALQPDAALALAAPFPASLDAVQVCMPGVTRGQMVTDVLLVAMWGALIPGVLWLGHAAGF